MSDQKLPICNGEKKRPPLCLELDLHLPYNGEQLTSEGLTTFQWTTLPPALPNCPFCGGKAVRESDVYYTDRKGHNRDAVICTECEAMAPADVWDKRVSTNKENDNDNAR